MSISTPWTVSSSFSRVALAGALLLLVPACEPKDGDDTGASSEASTTGEDSTTSGGSDSSTSNGGTASTGGTGVSGTATSTGTSGDSSTSVADTGEVTDSDPTVSTGSTTVATSTSGDPTGDPTTDSDTGNTDPPEPCVGDPKELELVTAMGYLKSQIPPDMTTSGGSSGSSSGGMEPDPKTLYLRLSSQIYSCKDPTANLECGPEWGVTIVIPPEFQTPGSIYNLAGQDVFAVFSETGVDEGGNNCSFGGGSGGGTFQILEIDDTQVKGRLCNVPDWFWFDTKPDLDGTFTAERCP